MSKFILFMMVSAPQETATSLGQMPLITPGTNGIDLSSGSTRVMVCVGVFILVMAAIKILRMKGSGPEETPAESMAKEASSHNDSGEYLLSTGETDEAISEFAAAIRRNPANVDAWRNRGLAHLKLGQLKKACRDFKEVLSLYPDCPVAHDGLEMATSQLEESQRTKQLHKLIATTTAVAAN